MPIELLPLAAISPAVNVPWPLSIGGARIVVHETTPRLQPPRQLGMGGEAPVSSTATTIGPPVVRVFQATSAPIFGIAHC